MIKFYLFYFIIFEWWLGVMEGFEYVKELFVLDFEKYGYMVKIYCKYNVKIYYK